MYSLIRCKIKYSISYIALGRTQTLISLIYTLVCLYSFIFQTKIMKILQRNLQKLNINKIYDYYIFKCPTIYNKNIELIVGLEMEITSHTLLDQKCQKMGLDIFEGRPYLQHHVVSNLLSVTFWCNNQKRWPLKFLPTISIIRHFKFLKDFRNNSTRLLLVVYISLC